MIVMFAVLELNKNSLFGWFLAFLATAICFSLSVRYSGMKNYEEKIRRFFGAYADDVLKIYDAKSDEEADRYWAEIFASTQWFWLWLC